MTKIFIAGSISITRLDFRVRNRIDNIIQANHTVIVGDADGADRSIQAYLFERRASATVVYCSGDKPRNNIGQWPINCVQVKHAAPGSRLFFTAKDIEMVRAADFGLMIWDAQSTGTLHNVIELLRCRKKSVVFVNHAKQFQIVGNVSQLENLIGFMSEPAMHKADKKIRLHDMINELRHGQSEIF
ncbi:hypothetical protein A6V36_01765 [Paraburkholderia ginsengiterrae]|uniref:Uncharacterized protein n=1 Tax=Paraburkholderia ginsengiterrae TaxID=1462993 RepID=A0A1A9NCX4_9BURK|nr:hypothetical protein [Paraburkholderia ginsengiterrae]OAJ60546.1 hypothetical protein A6V36_01765 [Paraburkholderia ginsengiterrae]OAJ64099.1 hypothetical protein A6V37_00960 [Paraburkholderia ginsengiterrae]